MKFSIPIIICIILSFGLNKASGQANIDTIKYVKEGELRIYRSGSTIIHSRPHWRKKFSKKAGLNLIYRKDSSLYFRGNYGFQKDSILAKHGKFEYYYRNGQLRDVGLYKNNQRTGVWKHYEKNGNLKFEQNHTSFMRVYYFANGDTLAYGTMQPQKDTAAYEFFNLTDHEGYWVFKNPDGSCNCRGKLSSSLKHGKWYYYTKVNGRQKVIRRRYRRYVANHNYELTESCKWQ